MCMCVECVQAGAGGCSMSVHAAYVCVCLRKNQNIGGAQHSMAAQHRMGVGMWGANKEGKMSNNHVCGFTHTSRPKTALALACPMCLVLHPHEAPNLSGQQVWRSTKNSEKWVCANTQVCRGARCRVHARCAAVMEFIHRLVKNATLNTF